MYESLWVIVATNPPVGSTGVKCTRECGLLLNPSWTTVQHSRVGEQNQARFFPCILSRHSSQSVSLVYCWSGNYWWSLWQVGAGLHVRWHWGITARESGTWDDRWYSGGQWWLAVVRQMIRWSLSCGQSWSVVVVSGGRLLNHSMTSQRDVLTSRSRDHVIPPCDQWSVHVMSAQHSM